MYEGIKDFKNIDKENFLYFEDLNTCDIEIIIKNKVTQTTKKLSSKILLKLANKHLVEAFKDYHLNEDVKSYNEFYQENIQASIKALDRRL